MLTATEERRATKLAAQLKAFDGWKCFQRKLMQLDEEIVRTLPRDQSVMTE